MLEAAAFDFEPHRHSMIITNLGDLLNYMGCIDRFKNFDDQLQRKIISDITRSDTLGSNLHYRNIKDTQKRLSIYEKKPVCFKLADFSESKSRQVQTAVININTGHG